jgi:MtN3 and saliva related transmembrane protein
MIGDTTMLILPHFNIILGFIANIMSNVAFIPQIVRSFRRKSVDDVSIGMFTVLFTTQLCWIGYSIPIHARQLWVSSLTEIILLLPIFALYIKYRKPKIKICQNKSLNLLPPATSTVTVELP